MACTADYRSRLNDCAIRRYDARRARRFTRRTELDAGRAASVRDPRTAHRSPPSGCSPTAASPGSRCAMIAAEAGVNWSLVGYYFRGKDGLLAEVYRRHCTTLNAERLRLLAEARRARPDARVRDRSVRPAGARRDPGRRRQQSVLAPARHARRRRRAALHAARRRQLRPVEPHLRRRAARVPAGAARGRGPVAIPLHAGHDLLLREQPAAHQGVLAAAAAILATSRPRCGIWCRSWRAAFRSAGGRLDCSAAAPRRQRPRSRARVPQGARLTTRASSVAHAARRLSRDARVTPRHA